MLYYKVPLVYGSTDCSVGNILCCAYPQGSYMVCKFERVAKVGSGWVKITAEEFEANCPEFPAETEADGVLTHIDFSNLAGGSFDETVDGETIPHAVTYDDKGRPASVDGVTIEWGDSDVGPVESTEYPGCSYRTVDGEKEWINPPMIAGEAYRTQERHNGKAVYAACVRHEKAIGSNGTTTVHQHTLMLAAAPHIVSLSGVVSNAYGEAFPSSKYGDLKTEYYDGELCINFNVTEAMPESTVDIIVKFTLD